jgi:hypothetical protein
MKRTQRTAVFAVALMLALGSVAMGASKSGRISKYLTVEGRVLQINAQDRTLLVSDFWSKTLYLIHVPEDGGFRITFGMNMKIAEPDFRHVRKNDRVRMRCTRSEDRLARLADGREVIALTASR